MANSRHLIPFSEALNYIDAFISLYPAQAAICNGGFLDKQKIETIFDGNIAASLDGIIMWFCFNQFQSTYPYFFVACADKNNYDPSNTSIYPDPTSTEYFCAQFTHSFTAPLTPSNLYEFLTEPNTDVSMVCKNIPNASVVLFNNKYMSPAFPVALDNKYYNTNRHGFFIEKETGIKELLEDSGKDVEGINYYFGVDIKNRKICLILFAVDKQGKNIINNSNGSPAIIFEKSYP